MDLKTLSNMTATAADSSQDPLGSLPGGGRRLLTSLGLLGQNHYGKSVPWSAEDILTGAIADIRRIKKEIEKFV